MAATKFAMIAGFDHIVIAVRDLARGVAAYETLPGLRAGAPQTRDGAIAALIESDNIAVELMAPDGAGESANRLRAALDGGEGLKSVVFASADIERAHQRATRVGLAPEPIRDALGAPDARVFRLAAERTHGVRMFVMQRAVPFAAQRKVPSAVLGIDHVVVKSAAPERAAALYGAQLGLDLRLSTNVMDRTLLLLRCGDAMLEVVASEEGGPDALWGLSWRVADADAARTRLRDAGLDVSDVRSGFKPGTRVFTVRDGTCGVPSLMVEAQRAQ